jgi:hypothetical protein
MQQAIAARKHTPKKRGLEYPYLTNCRCTGYGVRRQLAQPARAELPQRHFLFFGGSLIRRLFTALWSVWLRRLLLLTLLEIFHLHRPYNAHVLVQNDQILEMEFAHDFTNFIHRLVFKAVVWLPLHHTAHRHCFAGNWARTCSLLRALSDGLPWICRLLWGWPLAIDLSDELCSRFDKWKILRPPLTTSLSETHRKECEEYPTSDNQSNYFHGEQLY